MKAILTRKTITPKMFDRWKNSYRRVFKKAGKDEEMNLINICLNELDKGKNIEVMNKRLMEFYENDLTHEGKLHCEHCGNKMEVYYTSHCFKCKKPKEKNYLMAVNWLKYNAPNFNADKFWDELSDRKILKGNDTYIRLVDSRKNDAYGNNLRIFRKHFPIKGRWFVSW